VSGGLSWFFEGENRPAGARLSYVVNPPSPDTAEGASGETDAETEVTIEILDDGEVIRTLTDSATPGVNRTTWGLRRSGVRSPTTSNE